MPTFLSLGMGRLTPADALAKGAVQIEGDPSALNHWCEVFGANTADHASGSAPAAESRHSLDGFRAAQPVLNVSSNQPHQPKLHCPSSILVWFL